jgi:regulator of RNase E activity RraA
MMIEQPLLPTAAVADALIRLGQPIRSAPPSVRRLVPGEPVVGRAVPVRHFGSVDVFLEVLERASDTGVLVIDNGGRADEACIGDLTVAEVKLAGLAGIILWGFHRDESAVREIGLPVWSLGALPAGPRSARERVANPFSHAMVGDERVTPTDIVLADDDGVLFLADNRWPEVSRLAAEILGTEGSQAADIAAGASLRQQLRFDEYLERRAADPNYTFRRHLSERGGAIET